jgi:hypothetical protein
MKEDYRELGRCRLSFLDAGVATAFAQISILSLGATGGALGAGDDIDDDASVVFATVRAGAVRDAQFAAFALRETHPRYRVVTTALGRLGMISTHADYHGATIAY